MPEYTALQKDYAKYRLDKSKEDLEAAHFLFSQGSYRIANDRAYYSIFHALRAVFTIRNVSDYDDMLIASKAETDEQISNAEWVYMAISSYIEELG